MKQQNQAARTFDLAQVFGQDENHRVKLRDGSFCDLLGLNALPPDSIMKLQALQDQIRAIPRSSSGKYSQANQRRIEKTISTLLKIVSPEMPLDQLSFAEKVAILTYYNRNLVPAPKKKISVQRKRTGG